MHWERHSAKSSGKRSQSWEKRWEALGLELAAPGEELGTPPGPALRPTPGQHLSITVRTGISTGSSTGPASPGQHLDELTSARRHLPSTRRSILGEHPSTTRRRTRGRTGQSWVQSGATPGRRTRSSVRYRVPLEQSWEPLPGDDELTAARPPGLATVHRERYSAAERAWGQLEKRSGEVR
jgi:hypothetical protein